MIIISCSNKNDDNKSDVINKKKEPEKLSQPTTCLFPDLLTVNKLKNIWKKPEDNKIKIDYYYFDSENFKKCSLSPDLKNIISNEEFKYTFQKPDKIEIYNDIARENIEVYLIHNYSLTIKNTRMNSTEILVKVDPLSDDFSQVKSICNF